MNQQRDNYLPSWFLQMYISFSAEVIFVALHLFAYGSILLPVTTKGKYVQMLILILKNGPSGPQKYCHHQGSRRKQELQCIYSTQFICNMYCERFEVFHSGAVEDCGKLTDTNSSYWCCAINFRIKQSYSQPVGSYIRQHYNPLKGW